MDGECLTYCISSHAVKMSICVILNCCASRSEIVTHPYFWCAFILIYFREVHIRSTGNDKLLLLVARLGNIFFFFFRLATVIMHMKFCFLCCVLNYDATLKLMLHRPKLLA